MRRNGFRLSDPALLDLAAIADRIGDDSSFHAKRFVDAVFTKCGLLAANPGIGRRRPGIGHVMRWFPIGKYVIFYVPGGPGIEIVRVLHGARDLDSILGAAEDDDNA